MELDASFEGVEETLEMMDRFIEAEERAAQEALEYILRVMCNYVKQNGPWTDRTSNLRNSISINYETMKEWPADTNPQTLASVAGLNEKPVLSVEGDDYVGVLSAGMEYAIWVEIEEGYWVLTGAIDKFEPLIDQYMYDHLAVEKLDLDYIASVQYAKQFGG